MEVRRRGEFYSVARFVNGGYSVEMDVIKRVMIKRWVMMELVKMVNEEGETLEVKGMTKRSAKLT